MTGGQIRSLQIMSSLSEALIFPISVVPIFCSEAFLQTPRHKQYEEMNFLQLDDVPVMLEQGNQVIQCLGPGNMLVDSSLQYVQEMPRYVPELFMSGDKTGQGTTLTPFCCINS